MKKLIFISFLLFLVFEVFAQRNLHCAQGELPCIEKNFNTLVHISVDSTTRNPIIDGDSIQTILENTSKYFEAICITFSNCEINVMEDNYSYNDIMKQPIALEYRLSKMEKIYSKPNRINIFIINSIDSIIGGYGQFEGILKPDSMNVWIELENHEFELSENLAHQLGHFFGLKDTYDIQDLAEDNNGGNCAVAGDLICDTPTDPYSRLVNVAGNDVEYKGAYIDTSTCEFIYPYRDRYQNPYYPDVNNLMSQYVCKCKFSCEQFFRMAAMYDIAKIKPY